VESRITKEMKACSCGLESPIADFSLDIVPTFVRIWIIIPGFYSAIYSTLESMDEMNFLDPIFRFGIPHLESLTSGRLRLQKASLRNIRFSLITLVCTECFTHLRCVGYGNFCRFFLWIRPVRNFQNVWRQQSPPLRHYGFATYSGEIRCV